MSCLENITLEEKAFEDFCFQYDSSFSFKQQVFNFRERQNDHRLSDEQIDTIEVDVFEYLLEINYEETLRNAVELFFDITTKEKEKRNEKVRNV